MLNKMREDNDIDSIRNYVRKLMRDSHLFQFCKLVTDVLDLEKAENYINENGYKLSNHEIVKIQTCL